MGIDWNTNVQNKPVTISQEQAEAIETNSQKRSYPVEDQEKLARLSENPTQAGADWNVNLQNIPLVLLSLIKQLENLGATNIIVTTNGDGLRIAKNNS